MRGIRRAIRKRKRVYTFPLPMRFLSWVLTLLPRFVVARTVKGHPGRNLVVQYSFL